MGWDGVFSRKWIKINQENTGAEFFTSCREATIARKTSPMTPRGEKDTF